MARIDIAAFDDEDVASLPNTLLFATFLIPTLPGTEGAEEIDLGGGITRVRADFLGSAIEIDVEDYVAGPRLFGDVERVTLLDGVVLAARVIGPDLSQEATDLGIVVSEFLPALDGFLDGSDEDTFLGLVFDLGWRIEGRSASDVLSWDPSTVGQPEDILFRGNDTFVGGGGPDEILLYDGNDRGLGGGGNDLLQGGAGRDILKGGQGKDTLIGGAGNDVLNGGKGADRFEGGAGRDKHILGPGSVDRIVFGENAGRDVVRGFDPATDRIILDGVSGVALEERANGLRVVHEGGHADLIGVAAEDLATDDIVGW